MFYKLKSHSTICRDVLIERRCGGDIALLTSLCLCFSLPEIAAIVWIASMTGLIESRFRRRAMIHFGPHLAAATLCCWYLKVIL